jgi:hypothetical protein
MLFAELYSLPEKVFSDAASSKVWMNEKPAKLSLSFKMFDNGDKTNDLTIHLYQPDSLFIRVE